MNDLDDSRGPRDSSGPSREQTGNSGDVTVPIVTGTDQGDGKGWKLGGPLGLLIDLIRGK